MDADAAFAAQRRLLVQDRDQPSNLISSSSGSILVIECRFQYLLVSETLCSSIKASCRYGKVKLHKPFEADQRALHGYGRYVAWNSESAQTQCCEALKLLFWCQFISEITGIHDMQNQLLLASAHQVLLHCT